MPTVIPARDFGLLPNETVNASPAALRALEACRGFDEAILRFEPGTYHFRPEQAHETLCWISNNDSGLKRIAFPMIGHRNLTIDGGGAEFIFHEAITPFMLDGASGIALRDLTLDWSEPVTLTGRVQSVQGQAVTLALDTSSAYRFHEGTLAIGPPGWETEMSGFIELDAATLAPAYHTGDVWGGADAPWRHSFEELAPHQVRFMVPTGRTVTEGNHLVFLRGDRNNPAVFVTESQQVLLENVTVHQAPAMAFIAQRSTDLTLERFHVMFKPGREQIVTATADATHFVGCRGQITLKECLFEGQLDDPANIHGTYALVRQRLSDREMLLGRMHEQQKGVPYAGPGDRLRFYGTQTLNPLGDATVTAVKEVNEQDLRVTFDALLPDSIQSELVAENLSWVPDLTITGCTARRNRARGFLISTPGRVLVEGCTLSPGGTGILIPGECQFWYESGAVRDVTIQGNRFVNCHLGSWGRAAIDITPHIPQIEQRAEPFHRRIMIQDNRFETFARAILAAWSVGDLTFRSNDITFTHEYPPFGNQQTTLEFRSCENIVVEDNRLHGASGTVSLDARSAASAAIAPDQGLDAADL